MAEKTVATNLVENTKPIKTPATKEVAEEKTKTLLAKLEGLTRSNLDDYVMTILDGAVDDHPEPEEIIEYLQSSGLSIQDWNYYIAQASILK